MSNKDKVITGTNEDAPSQLYAYGFGICQPKSLQKMFNSPKVFLALVTMVNFMLGITVNGLLKVNVTSIERRFNLRSSELGLIVSAYDIAGCVSLLPVSYLGGTGHKPRWIGVGVILTSIGTFLLALPHFLTGPYTYGSVTGNTSRFSLCESGLQVTVGSANEGTSECSSTASTSMAGSFTLNDMKYIFVLGQFLTGIGTTPLVVLGVTFIDENVDPEVYPMYIGIYYVAAIIGPAAGFIMGGQLLKIFTELDVIPEDITTESPQWVGAWWIGFVVCAAVIFLLGIPILGFPSRLPSSFTRKPTLDTLLEESNSLQLRHSSIRKLSKCDSLVGTSHHDDQLSRLSQNSNLKLESIPIDVNTVQQEKEHAENEDTSAIKSTKSLETHHFQQFFRDFLYVIMSKAFVFLSLAAAVIGTLVSGFTTFGPKFTESQFSKSASDAANLFGYVMIPAAAGGLFLGSFLMSGLKMRYKSSLRMCFFVSVAGILVLFIFTLHCSDIPFAGLNHPYNSQIAGNASSDGFKSRCNAQCNCSKLVFDPVCGSDGVTYYSPCFAGCRVESESTSNKIFSNCSCIPGQNSDSTLANGGVLRNFNGSASQQACRVPCQWHDAIMVSLFFIIFTTFLCAVPGVDLSLRCFPQELRSLAVGVQWILIRTLGTIPGPIIFGAVIDGACQIWDEKGSCEVELGSCVMYKNQELSFTFLIVSLIYKGASVLFFGLALLTYRPAIVVASEPTPAVKAEISGVLL